MTKVELKKAIKKTKTVWVGTGWTVHDVRYLVAKKGNVFFNVNLCSQDTCFIAFLHENGDLYIG